MTQLLTLIVIVKSPFHKLRATREYANSHPEALAFRNCLKCVTHARVRRVVALGRAVWGFPNFGASLDGCFKTLFSPKFG